MTRTPAYALEASDAPDVRHIPGILDIPCAGQAGEVL
jgi:hypothetical protein